MLNIDELRQLVDLVNDSNITQFDYEYEGLKISIKTESAQAISQPSQNFQSSQNPTPIAQQVPVQSEPLHPPADTSVSEDKPSQNNMDAYHQIVSPMVGTFYRASAPDADPYIEEGNKVNPNTVVCIVEAMKLMNEIEAEVSGEVVKILVENGQLVEYGQPLFLVKPE